VIPLRRNDRCLYLDGHYQPSAERWEWKKGRWVLAPPGCYYAPPTTSYEQVKGGTTLVYRGGVWHHKRSSEDLCALPEPCPDKISSKSDPLEER
jgi:hypothetical protein